MTKLLEVRAAFVVCACLAASIASAQMPEIRSIIAPPELPGTISLPSAASSPSNLKEEWFEMNGAILVRNVTHASLSFFAPATGAATGTAVVVAPGGGYVMLSMESEGWTIAKWLAEHGIAAFVLKYRLDPTSADGQVFKDELVSRIVASMKPTSASDPGLKVRPDALADANAAMHWVRAHAAQYGIDPRRVGLMGFSAGAITALGAISVDTGDAMPDFIAPIYPPLQTMAVPKDAPPMFTAIAADDPLFAGKGFGLIESWISAKRPVEFHMYERGGHGFGSGREGTTTTHWLNDFMAWLKSRGL